MPRVSVIIPTYNRAHFLPRAVESVLAQSYRDLELMVVDDGSTDETGEVLRSFGNQIRSVQTAHQGSSCARNAGLELASGEYIAFLDSDDLWVPTKLERQVSILDADPSIGLVGTFTQVIDEAGRILAKESRSRLDLHEKALARGYSYEAMSETCILWPSSVLVRKVCLGKTGGFDPRVEALEDWDLYLQIALEWLLVCLTEPLTRFRFHAGRRKSWEFTQGRINTCLKHLAILDDHPELPFRKKAQANLLLNLARAYYMTAELGQCWHSLAHAIRMNPLLGCRGDVMKQALAVTVLRRGLAWVRRARGHLPDPVVIRVSKLTPPPKPVASEQEVPTR